jgi:hypothetical protein
MSTHHAFRSIRPALRAALMCAALTALTTAPQLAQAQAASRLAVSHYDVLRTELFSGIPVTAVFSPSQCPNGQGVGAKAAAPVVHGGFAVRDFMEVEGSNIGFANQHLTLRPDGTPVLELAQYRVTPDDKATVTVSFLSPLTYQAVSAPQTFQCAIGAGLDFSIGLAGLLRR